MKLVTINFSGNTGKTIIAKQLLAPRMNNAMKFLIEARNADSSDSSTNEELILNKDFAYLNERLISFDSAIIDICAYNTEDFIRSMVQLDGSHEKIDYFIIPVTSENKQQVDSIYTIKTLTKIGIDAKKIKVIFNKVEEEDINCIEEVFSTLHNFYLAENLFNFNTEAVILKSEVFDHLNALGKNINEVAVDQTDYRNMLREAKNDGEKSYAISMIAAKWLAKSAQINLDNVFNTLFFNKEELTV